MSEKKGCLIIRITTDRKFNVLSREVMESTEEIDYNPLVACLAEKYMKLNSKEHEGSNRINKL